MVYSGDDPRLKLDRVDEQLEEVERDIRAFLEGHPYRLVPEFDASSGEYGLRVRRMQDIPRSLSAKIGETLFNLRASLDHLCFALAEKHSNGAPPGTEFPIFHDPRDFTKVIAKGPNAGQPAHGSGRYKMRGVAPAAQALIEGLQPYCRTPAAPKTDRLWVLHALNITDKHHKPLLFGAITEQYLLDIDTFQGDMIVDGLQLRAGPFVDGAVVVTMRLTKPEVEMHFNATFEIAFDPKGPARGTFVIATLTDLRNVVRDVVFTQLEPFL